MAAQLSEFWLLQTDDFYITAYWKETCKQSAPIYI